MHMGTITSKKVAEPFISAEAVDKAIAAFADAMGAAVEAGILQEGDKNSLVDKFRMFMPQTKENKDGKGVFGTLTRLKGRMAGNTPEWSREVRNEAQKTALTSALKEALTAASEEMNTSVAQAPSSRSPG